MIAAYARASAPLLALTSLFAVAFAGLFRYLSSGEIGNWAAAMFIGLGALLAARRFAALRQLDIPIRSWASGAAVVQGTIALVCAVVATATMAQNQVASPYYHLSDRFQVTHGTAHHIDTNGEPYTLEGWGLDTYAVLLTFVALLCVFIAAACAGTAIGLLRHPARALGFGAFVFVVLAAVEPLIGAIDRLLGGGFEELAGEYFYIASKDSMNLYPLITGVVCAVIAVVSVVVIAAVLKGSSRKLEA